MGPATTALLTELRAWAAEPGAVMYPVQTTRGRVIVYPDEVAGRTDSQLVALICARLNLNK
ncbi:hypothetical protein [Massilia sp. Leaf139]|uniref:hypothetical protein n=1 Tax=Massilia sp. Leaf139 TaxID=1736272 RepID=UPI0007011442|nr:hypothetical protein [Massilia sp. Leaf139]KQQ90378.1 hypothetical protein ASF77_23275 [Massilia sp. Leaf139]